MASSVIRRLFLIACALVAVAPFARLVGAVTDGLQLPTLIDGPPRDGLGYAFDTRRHELLLYGARYPGIHLGPGSHTTAFDSGSFRSMTATGFAGGPSSMPGVRENAAAAYDFVGDRFQLFGGDSVAAQWTGVGASSTTARFRSVTCGAPPARRMTNGIA